MRGGLCVRVSFSEFHGKSGPLSVSVSTAGTPNEMTLRFVKAAAAVGMSARLLSPTRPRVQSYPRPTPARTVSVLPPYPRTVSVLPPYPRPTPAVLPSSRCFAVFSMCVQASRRPTTTTASRSTARLLRRSAYSLAARARHGGPALPLTDRAPARWPRHAHRRRKRTVCAAQPHTPS